MHLGDVEAVLVSPLVPGVQTHLADGIGSGFVDLGVGPGFCLSPALTERATTGASSGEVAINWPVDQLRRDEAGPQTGV